MLILGEHINYMRVICLYYVVIDDEVVVLFVHTNVTVHQQILQVVVVVAPLLIVVTMAKLDAVVCLNLGLCVNPRHSLAGRIPTTCASTALFVVVV